MCAAMSAFDPKATSTVQECVMQLSLNIPLLVNRLVIGLVDLQSLALALILSTMVYLWVSGAVPMVALPQNMVDGTGNTAFLPNLFGFDG
jgi:hypothetical protein